MGFSKPPAPPSVPMPPPAAHPPVLGSSTVNSALKAQKARANAAVFTDDDTIKTSPLGLTKPATTAKATLLGQ